MDRDLPEGDEWEMVDAFAETLVPADQISTG